MTWRTNKDGQLDAELVHEGFRVTITRSAGTDEAVVIFIDGPLYESDETSEVLAHREHDEMPDGSPRCRILLNDHPVYAAVDFESKED